MSKEAAAEYHSKQFKKEYHYKDFEWDQLRREIGSDPSLLYQDSDAWNKFHSRHSSGKFFKERQCLLREFSELLSSDKYSKVF